MDMPTWAIGLMVQVCHVGVPCKGITSRPVSGSRAGGMIKWRKCGDENPVERVRSGWNETLDVPLTCGNGDCRRSVERGGYLDTVGVTGSIPVSPTSYIRW
jgi:hypothetical protein